MVVLLSLVALAVPPLDVAAFADATYLGAHEEDIFGSRGSLEGDADGDGRPDLVVTAPHEDEAGQLSGSVYIFLDPRPGIWRADEHESLELTGAAVGDWAGIALSWVGDVDLDGDDDLLVGARASDFAGLHAGAAHVIRMPRTGEQSLSTADMTVFGAAPLDQLGAEVSAAGDVDGDGAPDLWLSAPYAAGDTGAVYLTPGGLLGVMPVDSVAFAEFSGERLGDYAGLRTASLGDASGDGVPDVAIGAEGSDRNGLDAGAVYLVTTPPSGRASLADADAVILGNVAGDNCGSAVFGLGDSDGDGLGDVGIQARDASPDGIEGRGVLYVLDAAQPLLALARSTFLGESPFDAAGSHTATCDVDGDGALDLAVTAHLSGTPGPQSGRVYLFHGPLPSGTVSLSEADLVIAGNEPYSKVGQDVSCADIDLDGSADLWIGAEGSIAEQGAFTGASYLLFGGVPVNETPVAPADDVPSEDPAPVNEPPLPRRAGSTGCDAQPVSGGGTGLLLTTLGALLRGRRATGAPGEKGAGRRRS